MGGLFFPPRPGKILKQALCVTTHYRLCATLKNTNYKAVKHNEENRLYSPLLSKNRSSKCFKGQYKICTPAHLSIPKYQNILLHRPSLNSLNNYTVNLKCIYLQNYKALTCKNIYMPYKINTTLEYFGSFTILYPPPPILNNPCNQTLFYNLSSANHKALQRTTASLSILISLHRQYLLDEKKFSAFIDNNSLFPPQVIAVQAPSSLLVAGSYQNHCISLATSCFALR